MKILKIGGMIAALCSMVLVTACSNVAAGHEGVIVSKTGGGVQEREVGEGWHFVPPTEDLIVYSLREQNFRFEASREQSCRVGDRDNYVTRAFCVQDRDGMTMGLDLGLRFTVQQGSSDALVRRYGGRLGSIIEGPIRNNLLNALTNNASAATAEEIYGEGRRAFLVSVADEFRASVDDLPLLNVEIFWLSEIALPPNVRTRIDEKNEAEQVAARRENEIATATAEAEIAIQVARGESESRLLRARAEAEALRVQGQALSENPEIIMLNLIEAWQSGGANVPQVVVMGEGTGTLPILDLLAN